MQLRHPALAPLLVIAVVGLSILAVSVWGGKEEKIEVTDISVPSDTVTTAQIAALNDIPLEPVLAALGVAGDEAAEHTLSQLGISPQAAGDRIKKQLILNSEHATKDWRKILAKFLLWFAFLPIPLILMVKRRLTPKRRVALYAAAVVMFGVALGADPSPMGTVKDTVYLLSAHGTLFPPRAIALGIFLLTVVVANKFICSWGCQFGALQDLLFRLGRNKRDLKSGVIRQSKIPFWITNTIRTAIFVAIILAGLAWTFDFVGYIDPFKIFHPTAMTIAGIGFVLLVLIASLFIYRPWCHVACPFGLVSWLFEKLSVLRIKVNYNACDACQACTHACPSHAMSGILNKKALPPDCFACGVCIETCPTQAISFAHGRDNLGRDQARDLMLDNTRHKKRLPLAR